MRDLNISIDLSELDGIFTYQMQWSDNPYIFTFTHPDQMKVLEVQNKLESRMYDYLNYKTDDFITSDIQELQYIKGEL